MDAVPKAADSDSHCGTKTMVLTDEGNQPVFACFVADVSSADSQAICEKFPDAGNNADRCGSGAERAHERSVEARTAFVSHIAEQIDDAHHEHESERRRAEEREGSFLHDCLSFTGRELAQLVDAECLFDAGHEIEHLLAWCSHRYKPFGLLCAEQVTIVRHVYADTEYSDTNRFPAAIERTGSVLDSHPVEPRVRLSHKFQLIPKCRQVALGGLLAAAELVLKLLTRDLPAVFHLPDDPIRTLRIRTAFGRCVHNQRLGFRMNGNFLVFQVVAWSSLPGDRRGKRL